MTKKRILIISLVIVLLIIAGVTAYALKNINEKPPVVVEQTVNSSTQENNAEDSKKTLVGTLVGVDDLHWGRGTIEAVDSTSGPLLVFKDDFEVARGPDLQVYLSPNPAGEDLGEFATLGALKANSGTQEYNLPTNYKDYKTVVIWCRAFSVTFATAELK